MISVVGAWNIGPASLGNKTNSIIVFKILVNGEALKSLGQNQFVVVLLYQYQSLCQTFLCLLFVFHQHEKKFSSFFLSRETDFFSSISVAAAHTAIAASTPTTCVASCRATPSPSASCPRPRAPAAAKRDSTLVTRARLIWPNGRGT